MKTVKTFFGPQNGSSAIWRKVRGKTIMKAVGIFIREVRHV
jgi:hypothetical protein